MKVDYAVSDDLAVSAGFLDVDNSERFFVSAKGTFGKCDGSLSYYNTNEDSLLASGADAAEVVAAAAECSVNEKLSLSASYTASEDFAGTTTKIDSIGLGASFDAVIAGYQATIAGNYEKNGEAIDTDKVNKHQLAANVSVPMSENSTARFGFNQLQTFAGKSTNAITAQLLVAF